MPLNNLNVIIKRFYPGGKLKNSIQDIYGNNIDTRHLVYSNSTQEKFCILLTYTHSPRQPTYPQATKNEYIKDILNQDVKKISNYDFEGKLRPQYERRYIVESNKIAVREIAVDSPVFNGFADYTKNLEVPIIPADLDLDNKEK